MKFERMVAFTKKHTTSPRLNRYQEPCFNMFLILLIMIWSWSSSSFLPLPPFSVIYQVRVVEDERDMLRYLWWPGGKLGEQLQKYRMRVYVFGVVSLPSCANYVLKKIATDCQSSKPMVSKAILSAFYVDDMLRSFKDEDEAIEVSKSVQQTLKEGGFRLNGLTTAEK